jgi:alkanesulfonate monooxygenase SsuD/methylene tetrahydromethanopterin reductase-like flavin-dependent oxidoreductase (luciferase family)
VSGTETRPVCRHCHQAPVTRPRRLCWGCYYRPGVAALYPTESKFGRRGVGNGRPPRKLPRPTMALAGSVEKVAVLVARAAAGLMLWNPKDAIAKADTGTHRRGGRHHRNLLAAILTPQPGDDREDRDDDPDEGDEAGG